jgi:hypothetical protein
MTKYFLQLMRKLFPVQYIMWENFQVLAFKYGQWRSVKNRMAEDAKGQPNPWYTYPAIEYLNSFNFTQLNVFEFGTGNSSLYWSSRAKSLVSVEDNLEWYEIVNKNKRNNQTVIHCSEKEAYVNALAAQNTDFDIIVIDGNHRLSCAIEAMKMIKPDGIILLDNSDRLIEKECGKLFRDNGFIQIDFSGFGPINGYCWTTSIFLKSSKLFSENFLGPAPIGGLNN